MAGAPLRHPQMAHQEGKGPLITRTSYLQIGPKRREDMVCKLSEGHQPFRRNLTADFDSYVIYAHDNVSYVNAKSLKDYILENDKGSEAEAIFCHEAYVALKRESLEEALKG